MARISILIPHYKTWKMSFYAIHQLLKCKGPHQMDIYVVDNNAGDGTADKLRFFGDKIHIVPYPPHMKQSHGIAYDFIIPYLRTELFATIESDSFPTKEDGEWLTWIELLAKDGYSSAGSLLDLSGGNFVHTAGAFYKKSIWQQCKRYVEQVEYVYFPNIAMKDAFPCHLMVHNSVLDQFMRAPEKLITLAPEYVGKDEDYFAGRLAEYMPIGRGVFHNGIGNSDESFPTYAQRHAYIEGDRNNILQDNKKPLIWRLGMEPGQYFCLWQLANNHNVYDIPTETIWMPGRENQQQERTVMENGFTHLWAITAYSDVTDPALKDIIDYKKNMMEELYLSIPATERI
jgi:hypothetical protein